MGGARAMRGSAESGGESESRSHGCASARTVTRCAHPRGKRKRERAKEGRQGGCARTHSEARRSGEQPWARRTLTLTHADEAAAAERVGVDDTDEQLLAVARDRRRRHRRVEEEGDGVAHHAQAELKPGPALGLVGGEGARGERPRHGAGRGHPQDRVDAVAAALEAVAGAARFLALQGGRAGR